MDPALHNKVDFHDLTIEPYDPIKAMEELLVKCLAYYDEHPVPQEPDVVYCNTSADSFVCWPITKAGHYYVQDCPNTDVSGGIGNVSRFCLENGTWLASNYSECLEDSPQSRLLDHFTPLDVFGVRMIYSVGNSISLFCLIVAFIILVYFKSLRCLRNIIHCHFIMAFILFEISWIVLHYGVLKAVVDSHAWLAKIVMSCYHCFQSATFFWMFVEGLYLFTIIVWAFSAQKVRIWHYAIIGWGVPLVNVAVWAIVRSEYKGNESLSSTTRDWWLPFPNKNWSILSDPDNVLYGPIVFVLVCNVFFITVIVYVLVTKLRASNTLETRQWRKAVRATVILLPLLGISFVFFLMSPMGLETDNTIYKYMNAICQSSQGMFVAIIYCFSNGEVRTLLKKKYSSVRERWSLTRYSKSSFFGSPRRSSYAMTLTTTNGRQNGSRRNSAGSHKANKMMASTEGDTEACASMMENIV